MSTPRWVFRIDRGITPDLDQMMTYGTCPQSDGPAEYVSKIQEWTTRVGHSYAGPLVVSIWQAGPEEHYRNPVPDHATQYVYQVVPIRDGVTAPPRATLYSDKCDECTTGISCEEAGHCLFEG